MDLKIKLQERCRGLVIDSGVIEANTTFTVSLLTRDSNRKVMIDEINVYQYLEAMCVFGLKNIFGEKYLKLPLSLSGYLEMNDEQYYEVEFLNAKEEFEPILYSDYKKGYPITCIKDEILSANSRKLVDLKGVDLLVSKNPPQYYDFHKHNIPVTVTSEEVYQFSRQILKYELDSTTNTLKLSPMNHYFMPTSKLDEVNIQYPTKSDYVFYKIDAV